MTTPPPSPVSDPRNPAMAESSSTRPVNSRLFIIQYESIYFCETHFAKTVDEPCRLRPGGSAARRGGAEAQRRVHPHGRPPLGRARLHGPSLDQVAEHRPH